MGVKTSFQNEKRKLVTIPGVIISSYLFIQQLWRAEVDLFCFVFNGKVKGGYNVIIVLLSLFGLIIVSIFFAIS